MKKLTSAEHGMRTTAYLGIITLVAIATTLTYLNLKDFDWVGTSSFWKEVFSRLSKEEILKVKIYFGGLGLIIILYVIWLICYKIDDRQRRKLESLQTHE